MPVILWTDALIFLLLAVAVGLGIYASRHEHLRAPWREVARSRQAAVTGVLLAAFGIVGLLDSLHFRPSAGEGEGGMRAGQVISVLDALAAPLRERTEKTYSAPFAWRLYTRETIELPDGRTVRDYPRLRYGGAHLADPERERAADILHHLLVGTLKATVLWLLLAALLVHWLAGRHRRSFSMELSTLLRGRGELPWRTLLLTFLAVLIVVFVCCRLSLNYHIFGTDKVGQDVFYQSVKSIRTGLVIGTLTTLVMLPFAIALGVMAGYFRGLVDDLIQYLYTTLNSIPGVLLIAAAILMLQVYMANHADQFTDLQTRADLRLLFLCIILGVTSWTGLCRLLRGESLKLREVDYVLAARAFGVSHGRILLRHLLPNVMHIVLISVVLDFSGLVLAEAVLSYINIGVDPSMQSWGNMINSARLEMARDPVVWWSLVAAFTFMFALVLSANLFSDVVRDAFDPRLRNQARS